MEQRLLCAVSESVACPPLRGAAELESVAFRWRLRRINLDAKQTRSRRRSYRSSTAMKRASPASSDSPATKRSKASQACASCRRQKSRCEILDVRTHPGAPVSIRCHRCKVLGIQCSFETSDLIHFLPKPTATTPTQQGASPSTVSDEPSPPEYESYGGLNTLATVASSRPNVEPVTVNSIPSRYGMLPEDLVPTATTPIWGCVSRVDWTATPMLAIQEMVRCPRTDHAGPELPSGGRLADIVSPPEITSLLEMFVLVPVNDSDVY